MVTHNKSKGRATSKKARSKKSKKAVKKRVVVPMELRDATYYRKQHKVVPAELYEPYSPEVIRVFRTKGGIKAVRMRHNFGPLGRPPSYEPQRSMYEQAKGELTPHGLQALPLKKQHAYLVKKDRLGEANTVWMKMARGTTKKAKKSKRSVKYSASMTRALRARA